MCAAPTISCKDNAVYCSVVRTCATICLHMGGACLQIPGAPSFGENGGTFASAELWPAASKRLGSGNLQGSTVQVALNLLTRSLADINMTLSIVVDSGSGLKADSRVMDLASSADRRADDVCSLGRRLLHLLRPQHSAQPVQGVIRQGDAWLCQTSSAHGILGCLNVLSGLCPVLFCLH